MYNNKRSNRVGLMVAGLLLLALNLTSCTKDTDSNPAPRRTPPTALFLADSGGLTANQTISRNQPFRIDFRTAKGSSNLTVGRFQANTVQGTGTFINEDYNLSSSTGNVSSPFEGTRKYRINSAGVIKFKIFGRDLNNLEDSTVIRVTVN